MVVDPIMRSDDRLSRINPYFDDGCAYKVFYSMTVNGKPILETLYEMYTNLTEVVYMVDSDTERESALAVGFDVTGFYRGYKVGCNK